MEGIANLLFQISTNVKKCLITVIVMLSVLIQLEAMTVSAMMAMKEMVSTVQVC